MEGRCWHVCYKYIPLTKPGDVSLSAEDRPPPAKPPALPNTPALVLSEPPPPERVDFPPPDVSQETAPADGGTVVYQEKTEEHRESWLGGEQAVKFLLAGGIAGAGGWKAFT